MTLDDLRAYRAVWRPPVSFRYRNHTVFSMPPPSSGGITLAMIGNILGGYDLSAAGWPSAQTIHLLAEAMRRAYADRNHYLGDPDFVSIPEAMLLSPAYAARRRATILPDRATPSRDVGYGTEPLSADHPHTTHFSVVDDRGNAVAMTTTLNLGYGSGVTVTGAGFLLNDEMDDFAARPGAENVFGLVQGEANAIAPGKRMLSSMSPAIVLDTTGHVLLVTGGAGGPRIISGVFEVISNILDHHLPLDSAMLAPRIHHQHLPDRLELDEHAFASAVIARLREMGYVVKETKQGSALSSILRVRGVWQGMAEPGGTRNAEGY
jgi:gamma-glutamyltranspeptidase/glutathione hydrolase